MNFRLAIGFGCVFLVIGAACLPAQDAPPKPPGEAGKPAAAPPRWEWPMHPENLKVLPKDTPPEHLRGAMMAFTRALGVRCVHCHVGEDGKPLSTFDFPSDKNPNKDRARKMMEMTGKIREMLAGFDSSDPVRVEVGCATCHQGRARPMSLGESLDQAARTGGVDAAVARYRELREKFYGRGGYDFGERSLNDYGYGLLEKGDAAGAVKILALNAEQYPASGNAFDSLGEAYAATGQKEKAVEAYRKALELDPKNDNAREKLTELTGGKPSS